ncbi:hypothetical protein K501DRAFT_246612 [Backusella circina FSU 941]|nr:hypothetical protein K501DRAFT_246612 [Backusella circina FSU 941]
MEGSSTKYKLIQYNDNSYYIPIRVVKDENVLFLSDVQAVVPNATALLSSHSKLIPFQLDPDQHNELLPKRVIVTESESVWKAHVPESNLHITNSMETRLEILSEQIQLLLLSTTQQQARESESNHSSLHNEPLQNRLAEAAEEEEEEEEGEEDTQDTPHMNRPCSPPPAFSPLRSPHPSTSQQPPSSQQVEAPPSYETSVLSSISILTEKLRLYESHIANRHKSPQWLAKRSAWLSRNPINIEQLAFQLVELEMALLWTAVSEAWINERETFMALVGSARSERHLAGAILNLERHTLVMDGEWVNVRENWINGLLDMLVIPISHG